MTLTDTAEGQPRPGGCASGSTVQAGIITGFRV